MNQDEIHEAVEAYVRNQITIAANQRIDISFTAGRGENGLSAELNISAAALAPKPAVLRGPSGAPAIGSTRPVPATKVSIPVSRSISATPEAREEIPEAEPETEPEIVMAPIQDGAVIDAATDVDDEADDEAERTAPVEEEVAEEAPAPVAKAPAPRTSKSIFSKAS